MHLPIRISSDSPDPIYHQIKTQLRELILSGQLAAATSLPSIREFSQELGCSVITTRRVYSDLENEGLIRTRQGIGSFVAEVEITERDRFKYETVREAFRQAIDTGLRIDCPAEELKKIFDQVLKQVMTENDAGSKA